MKRILLFTILTGLINLSLNCQEVHKKRIGIIGLDTSHALEFAKLINGKNAKADFAGYRVTMAYPWGSRTIEIGYSRIPAFTDSIKKMGVKIAGSIDELLAQVDYVFLETQDGSLHVDQALAVFKAGKPVFIDKPLASSLTDVCLIYELAKKYKDPVFASSSMRYIEPVADISAGKKGKVLGADCFGPCQEEPSHPSLFWYGIHGVEMLFTVMGTGCETVTRTHTDETDLVVGTWKDKRVGTYRGMRVGQGPYYHYGGFAYCENEPVPLDNYSGYGYFGMMKEIVNFFATGTSPVAAETTIEIYGFMEASNQSLKTGKPVSLSEIIETARNSALKKLEQY